MCTRSFIVRILAIVLCTWAGSGSVAVAAEPRIAVSRSPLSLPFFVAKEKNLFAKHKVEPVLVQCMGGHRCMKELVEGRVDMATSTELPFMFAVFEGAPISLITTFVTSKNDMRLIVRKSVLQGGVKSLTGKRVGYVEKASSHYYRDLFLLYHGVDPLSIIPVPMDGEALATALVNGEVDAISVWEPWGHVALKLGGADVAVVDAPRLYGQTFNLMAANAYRQIHGRQVGAVLAALNEAIQFIKANPYQAKRILARDTGVDPAIVEVLWPTYRFESSLQQSLLTTLQGQARWARREGHVDKSLREPEFLNFIDASLLRKQSAKAVDYVYP